MSSPTASTAAIASFAILASLTAVATSAQTAAPPDAYTPTLGQAGKDVIWVPTPDGLVERMLRMADAGPEDFVIDLGSGDGRTVITAAKDFGARGLGIEYNPDMVALSQRNAERAGVSDKVDFVEADIFEADFSRATVLTMYLLPSLNLRLRPRILDLQPGTRVLSSSFDMGDWRADDTVTFASHTAYLWIVPADVDGRWQRSHSAGNVEKTWTLRLDQDFQVLSGRVYLGDDSFPVLDGHVRGAALRFDFVDGAGGRHRLTGRVYEDRLEGAHHHPDGTTSSFRAVRGSARSSSGA